MTQLNLFSKRILILHATAGAGHRKAAEAIFHGFQARNVPWVSCVDALDHTSNFFRKAYSDGYEFMVGKLSQLWAVFFWLTDQPWMLPVFQGVRRLYNGLNSKKLVRFVQESQPDVIVTTHFFSVEVVGHMKKRGETQARLVVIVTDYDVHKIWLAPCVDLYCVASEYTKGRLAALGVAEEKIVVTGIPVDEKFVAPRDKAEVRRKLGLREDLFTVLLSTSSFGMGPIAELCALLKDTQLIVICGNNKALKETMAAKGNPLHKICGFVDNMEEMMAASDVMLTKPGGLSVSESLANHLPLIFFSAIPGQEAGNVRVLAEHGIGLSNKKLPEIAEEIKAFQTSPEKLHAAREATKKLARPHSVEDIIKQII